MNPENPTVLLSAPTGVAAININGTTINAALAIPKNTGDTLPAMSELKLLVTDEISMVSNSALHHIHQRLKEIFTTSDSQLFAGLSVMRQKDDQPFIEQLNKFRTGSQTDEDVQCIQSRSTSPLDDNYPTDSLQIWAENNPVTQHNNAKLKVRLTAIDQHPANISKQDIDRVLATGRSETGGLDHNIFVKETARVMLTTNIDIADRLIHGQMGTIIKINMNRNKKKTSIIYIKFDDSLVRKALIDKCNKQNRLVPIEPILARFRIRPGKPSSPEIQQMQFPITLAWACTVHKVQGLTLDKTIISFELVKQRFFNYGQIYVAISRSTTLQGIHILGQIEHRHVRTNPKVYEEYRRLRSTSALEPPVQIAFDRQMSITLLNVRSLKKHSLYIKFHFSIFNSDLIALTETLLLPQTNDNDIKDNLEPFTI